MIFDSGNSYQKKEVFRGDYKRPEEIKAVREKKKLEKNDAPIEEPDKQD
ncbi:MAG: hypothetical protein ACJA0H_000212 [Francisellaceae bacterium]